MVFLDPNSSHHHDTISRCHENRFHGYKDIWMPEENQQQKLNNEIIQMKIHQMLITHDNKT